jgi:hypothetical protein
MAAKVTQSQLVENPGMPYTPCFLCSVLMMRRFCQEAGAPICPAPALVSRANTSPLGCCWRRRQWKNMSAHRIQPEILPRGIDILFYLLISLEIRADRF